MYRMFFSIVALSMHFLALVAADDQFVGSNCQLTSNGFYGFTNTHNVGFGSINYYYEMLIYSGASIENLKKNVDREIVESVLRSLNWFGDCLDDSERKLQGEDKLSVTGISTKPHDKQDETKKCNFHNILPGTECVVMKGHMTLYFEEDSTWQTAFKSTTTEIEEVLRVTFQKYGVVNDQHDGTIKEISYLTKQEFDNLPKNESKGEESGKHKGFNFFATSLAFCSTIVVLLLGGTMFKFARKKKSNNANPDPDFVNGGRASVV